MLITHSTLYFLATYHATAQKGMCSEVDKYAHYHFTPDSVSSIPCQDIPLLLQADEQRECQCESGAAEFRGRYGVNCFNYCLMFQGFTLTFLFTLIDQ